MYTPDPANDLKRALKALQDKQKHCARYAEAYSGDLPLPFLTDKLREVYKGLQVADVRENWAAIVIDACADKITLTGLTVDNEGTQETLNDLIAETELLLEADDAHKHALITGQSFIVAWRDEETGDIDLFYHQAFSCEIFHDDDNPNRPIFAAKWWSEASESEADKYHVYIKLYYANVLMCWKTDTAVVALKDVKVDNLVAIEEDTKNPFGVIPVFAFQPDRREIVSDLRDVIPAQNTINMLSVNEVVAGEFAAYPQKWAISNASNIGAIKVSPRTIIDFPASQEGEQDTSVGEFGTADLTNFGKAIERRIQGIAATTRTPLHYFHSTGSPPSGEALIALEAPLNNKAQDRIDRFTVTWKKLGAFLLLLSGVKVLPKDITPQFKKPETVQPRTYAEIFKMYHDAEFPMEANLRREGMPQEEIDRITKEAAETKRENIATALTAFNAGTDENGTPQPPNKKPMPPNAKKASAE